METTTVPDANDLPNGWWVASSLLPDYDRRLEWGDSTQVWGDYIAQDQLASIVADARAEAGLPDLDAEDEPPDEYDRTYHRDHHRW